MKAFYYKAKGAVALTLALTMFCPQVFAAEALSAEEQGVKAPPVVELTEEEKAALALPEITVEQALEKAIKHNPELKDLADTLEYLDDMDEDMYNSVGHISTPNYEHKRWTSDAMKQLVVAVYELDAGRKQARIYEQVQKMGLEVAVKSSFASIKGSQDKLALVKLNTEQQQKAYEQGYTKYRLGMLSKYDLDQLQTAAQQAKNNQAMLEGTLEQAYIKFNNLIGENPEKRFTFVYDLTFTPYEMPQDIDHYVRTALQKDLTIQLQEMAADKAKFTNNYRGYSDTVKATSMKDQLSYDQAQRALKTAKSDKELLIRNTYLTLQQMETMYASAEADLAKAQADLRATQLHYQVGNVTKTKVELAEMGVITAENALKEIVYNYDMLVYTFENPSLLAGTAAQ